MGGPTCRLMRAASQSVANRPIDDTSRSKKQSIFSQWPALKRRQPRRRENYCESRRQSHNICRRPENREIRCHAGRVLVGEMAINLSHKNAAVAMSKPSRNRHEVDAGHDAG